jgi:hypothetical protein
MAATQGDSWWRERGESELRSLLYEWDPIGVAAEPDWPGDEYDELVEPLRERLAAGTTAGELSIFLEHHVTEHIGLEVDADREERFAARLVEWWARR